MALGAAPPPDAPLCGASRSRGRLKVCALKHANSDKPRTQNSNGLIAFSELGFEMFGHGQSGLLLGGEPAKQAFVWLRQQMGGIPLPYPDSSTRRPIICSGSKADSGAVSGHKRLPLAAEFLNRSFGQPRPFGYVVQQKLRLGTGRSFL